MSSPLLTKGMLQYVFKHCNDPDFKFPEIRLQISRIRLIERNSERVTTPRYRVIVTDGEVSANTILPSDRGSVEINRMLTSSSYSIKNVQNKQVILFSVFEISSELLPSIDENASCREMIRPPELKDVKEEVPVSVPAPVDNNLPIVKQHLGENTPAPKPAAIKKKKPTTPISMVTPYNSKWIIQARVADKSDIIHYNKRTTGKLFNVTFLDNSGEIRATGFNEQVDAYYNKLEVGKVYYVSGCRVNAANKQFSKTKNDFELSLDRSTQIEPCLNDVDDIPVAKYNFVPLDKLVDVPPNDLVDVIGVLSHIDDVNQITTKKGDPFDKRDITIVDDTGYSVRCTVWGKQASEFKTPLEKVVAVKGAKVSDYGGRSLSLFSSSTFTVEPEIPEAFALQGWYLSRGKESSFQSLLNGNGQGSNAGISSKEERITIETAKLENLGMSEKPDVFVIKATVSAVGTNGTMYYPSCPDCMKKLVLDPDGGVWKCDKCNKLFEKPVQRYVLSVCLNDETGQIWASSFEESGATILGISANDLNDLRMEQESLFEQYTTGFPRVEYLVKIRAKQDVYQNVVRIRYSILTLSKINFVEEARRILDELKLAN